MRSAPGNAGRHRHLLRQALLAGEAAAREAAANGRQLEQTETPPNRTLRAPAMGARRSLRSRTATSLASRSCRSGSLGKRRGGKSAERVRAGGRRAVELRLPLNGHEPLEVREPPGDGHPEARGRRGEGGFTELDERAFECSLRVGEIRGVDLDASRHDLVVERRYVTRTLVSHEAAPIDVLLGRQQRSARSERGVRCTDRRSRTRPAARARRQLRP